MLDSETTKLVRAHLSTIASRLQTIERLVETEAHVAEIIYQIDDLQAALGKVGEVAFRAHVNNSVTAAIRDGDGRVASRKVGPTIAGLGRTSRSRRRVVGESS